MKTPIVVATSSVTGPSQSAVRYHSFSAGASAAGWASSALSAASPFPIAGTLRNLRVRFPAALSQGTYDVTIYSQTAGADTALTCQITTSSTTATDLTHSVSVAAGDKLAIKVTPTGTPTAQTYVEVSCEFEATASGKGVLFASSSTGTAANFLGPGANVGGTSTEALSTGVMPTGGSIASLYVSLGVAPGVGNSRTFTLRKAGSDTALTVTISDTNTTGNASSSISFADGDFVVVGQTVSGTPASSTAMVGMEWVPTTDGETPIFFEGSVLSASATRYFSPGYSGSQSDENESSWVAPIALALRNMRISISTATGAGKSRTFTVRNGGSDTALSIAFADASTITALDSDSVSIAGGDVLTMSQVPASSPATVTYNRVGIVAFIDPGGGGSPSTSGNLLLLGVG